MEIESLENIKIKAIEKYEGISPWGDNVIVGVMSALKYTSLMAGVYITVNGVRDEESLMAFLAAGLAYLAAEGIQIGHQRLRNARNYGLLEETLLKKISPEEAQLEENLSEG